MTNYKKYRKQNKIKNIYDYHPKNISSIRNPKHKGNSALIIKLKNKDKDAIKCIAANVMDQFPKVDVICSMPSSDVATKRNGIRMLAEILAEELGVVNGTKCLYRKDSRARSCSGNRDIDSHFSTLDVRHKHKLKGKKVLLLDDITTSGHSLEVGSVMLKNSGAKKVIKYALAATVYYGGQQ